MQYKDKYSEGNEGMDIITFAAGISSTRLTWMVSENIYQQFVGTLLVQVDNSVVKGILVLFQPTGDVVWYLFQIDCLVFKQKWC